MIKEIITERLEASTVLVKHAMQLPDITYALRRISRAVEPVQDFFEAQFKDLENVRRAAPKKINFETAKEYATAVTEYKKQVAAWIQSLTAAVAAATLPEAVRARSGVKGGKRLAAMLMRGDEKGSVTYIDLATEWVNSKSFAALLAGELDEFEYPGQTAFNKFLKEAGYAMPEGYEGSEKTYARNTFKALKGAIKLQPRPKKAKRAKKAKKADKSEA